MRRLGKALTRVNPFWQLQISGETVENPLLAVRSYLLTLKKAVFVSGHPPNIVANKKVLTPGIGVYVELSKGTVFAKGKLQILTQSERSPAFVSQFEKVDQ